MRLWRPLRLSLLLLLVMATTALAAPSALTLPRQRSLPILIPLIAVVGTWLLFFG